MSEIELTDAPAIGPAVAEVPQARRTTYRVEQYIDVGQMKKDLTYSAAGLTDAMMEQASMFAYYGVLAAQASRQVDTIKMLLETTEAAVYRKVVDGAALRGEKMTAPTIQAAVARDNKVLSMKQALNEAKQIEATGKIATEAFRHRRDMLVQQGFIEREERKGEVSVAVKNANEEVRKNKNEDFLARRAARLDGSSPE